MNMKRIKSIIIAFMLIAIMMTGCEQKIVITTGFDDGELVKISGKAVRLSEAMILLSGEKAQLDIGLDDKFWEIEYKEQTMLSYFKEEIKDEFVRINILSEFAKDKNVSLTEAEKKEINLAAKRYMEHANEAGIKKYNISEKDVESLMTKITLSDKVYEKVVNDYVVEISDEEARVMYADYIYIDTTAIKAAEISQEIHGKVVQGADFGTVAEKYDCATYGEAYFSRTDFEEEQSKEVFKLQDSQISSVFENDGKLYIVKCINDYDENMTMSNKSLLIEEKKTEEFDKEYRPYERQIDVEFNTELWSEVNIKEDQEGTGISVYGIMKEAGQQ